MRSPCLTPWLFVAVALGGGPLALAQAQTLQRIRLFRIQPGFVSELPWLESDDHASLDGRLPDQDADADLDWISVAAGNDNPHFELRQRGDPGGVGFARVLTQVQLFDTERTAFALGFQAVTPLGLEYDGLHEQHGPTVVTPALSLFHALDDGTALQAFVGKHVPLMNRAAQPVQQRLQYGLALQRPIVTDGADPLSSLVVSLGALAQVPHTEERGPMTWEVLPGLHWKPAETWWLSGGYVLPVGPARSESGRHWQLTCSWQY